MAYAERRDRSNGPRYRGLYRDTDGRYKSAGTYGTEERALEVAEAAEMAARSFFTALEEAGRSPNTIRQAKVVLAAMFTMAVGDTYLDANPFHDVKTPKVAGQRAIKIVTKRGQARSALALRHGERPGRRMGRYF